MVTFPKQKSVILPWADNASLKVGPGGGILRIMYDEERFSKACQEVIVNPKPEEKVLAIEESKVEEIKVEKVQAVKVEIKKEDILLMAKECDLTNKVAEALLKESKGVLLDALLAFTRR